MALISATELALKMSGVWGGVTWVELEAYPLTDGGGCDFDILNDVNGGQGGAIGVDSNGG